VSLLLASVSDLLVLRLLSGDLAQVIAGVQATPAQVEQLRHQLGTDRPLARAVPELDRRRADRRLRQVGAQRRGVSAELRQKLTVTGPLVLGSVVLSVLFAVPLGVLAAALHRRRLGLGITATSQLGIALPTLWVGLVLAIVFAVG